MVVEIGDVLAVVIVLFVLLLGARRLTAGPRTIDAAPVAELDVGRVPSEWFTDSRSTDGGRTEVCVVRVEKKSGLIRERRVLQVLDNADPDYAAELDKAMDRAYETMRVLNVNLRRR